MFSVKRSRCTIWHLVLKRGWSCDGVCLFVRVNEIPRMVGR